jgi:L-galactose dehydrogenase/L-glyceraldehyde 3-phosphate reductase
LQPLVGEGHAGSLAEAAVRFAISSNALSTAVLGLSSVEQLEAAAEAADKGPLAATALARLAELQGSFVGEPR